MADKAAEQVEEMLSRRDRYWTGTLVGSVETRSKFRGDLEFWGGDSVDDFTISVGGSVGHLAIRHGGSINDLVILGEVRGETSL